MPKAASIKKPSAVKLAARKTVVKISTPARKPNKAGKQLEIGSPAPDFSMSATKIGEVSRSKLKGKPFVLYFYPKDDTSGCTAEACGFRDNLPAFGKLGVPVIGVSRDSLESHEKFSKKYNLTFPLASDEAGKVTESFGVWVQKSMYGRTYMGIERSTFLIDAKGVVRAVWRKVKVPSHIDEVKKAVQDFKPHAERSLFTMTTATVASANPETIKQAADLLHAGKLVAFPTETVYGLGGDATNDRAVASIYEAKGRPQFNPLIIHVAEPDALDNLIEWNDTARALADQFWPGPLTLVLPRKKDCPVSLLASAGMDTLAVRIPSHTAAQQLLREVGKPIAAPSANISGKLSPTTAQHVAESLGDKVDYILAGGKSQVGVESTVLNLTTRKPVILRPGGVTKEQLEQLIGPIDTHAEIQTGPRPSPGMLPSHYAPNIPLRMNAQSVEADEALLAFGPEILTKGGAMRLNLSENGDLNEAAANLFAMLRQLDQPRFRGIAVMPVPDTGLGAAINDRLKRASL